MFQLEECKEVKKSTTQSATQTSPEHLEFCVIRSSSNRENKSTLSFSPTRNSKKDKCSKSIRYKRDRLFSSTSQHRESVKFKQDKSSSLSPSVAECLRAVFAAFLWHEGIVHDAMACASFIKFYPTLNKRGALMANNMPVGSTDAQSKMTKEQKARQRHSVEVSNHNYLNVQVSNTEELQKFNVNNKLDVEDSAECHSNSTLRNNNPVSPMLSTVIEGTSCSLSLSQNELPLVLKNIVYLWEEISASCFQSMDCRPMVSSVSTPDSKMLPTECRKNLDRKKNPKKCPLSLEQKDCEVPFEGNDEKAVKLCEICNQNLSSTETKLHYFHPEPCLPQSKSSYIEPRWNVLPSKSSLPGPFGEFFHGYYRLCRNCRKKYLPRNSDGPEKVASVHKSGEKSSGLILPKALSHLTVRNNAMFLLDLFSYTSSKVVPALERNSRQSFSTSVSCSAGDNVECSNFSKVCF